MFFYYERVKFSYLVVELSTIPTINNIIDVIIKTIHSVFHIGYFVVLC